MSDLTKRLRDREPCYPMRSLEIEAADRIEQLEAALRVSVGAMKHHVEQTRPIDLTTIAIAHCSALIGEE